MEKIRILHVFGGLNRGGAETMLMNLYRAIDRDRFQFDFIVHHGKMNDYNEEILSLGGRIFVFPDFSPKNFFKYKKHWKKFLSEHPEYRVLHSHVRSCASVYIPIAKKMGLKTIIHSHSTSNGRGIKSLIKKIMQYPLRRQADYFFGCSQHSGEWLFGKKIVKGHSYFTIANSVDTSKFSFNDTIRNDVRTALEIGDKKTFIHVGRLHEAKNHEFLIDVFSKIHDTDPNTVLLCLGDGDLMKPVCEKIAALGLTDSVKMLGSHPDIERYLMAADLFLFPSRWEGVPVTVVEAQAAGLPCIVSDRITDDVCVSELVKKLPIDQGVDCWVDAALGAGGRENVAETIIKAGYDVKNNAEWLEEFYLSLAEN